MKYFFDTEFNEDGKTIDLISIGIVAEDGREFYAVSREFNRVNLLESPWLIANVLPGLPIKKVREDRMWSYGNFNEDYSDPAWKSRREIRDDILAFVGDDPEPEFWAYYADYDWVAFCQLFGRMIDLPRGFPKFCRDLKQLAVMLQEVELPPDPTDAHNALADARWNRDVFDVLEDQVLYGIVDL